MPLTSCSGQYAPTPPSRPRCPRPLGATPEPGSEAPSCGRSSREAAGWQGRGLHTSVGRAGPASWGAGAGCRARPEARPCVSGWWAIGRASWGQSTCASSLGFAASLQRSGCVSDSKQRRGPGRGAALPSCPWGRPPPPGRPVHPSAGCGATLPLPEWWPSRPGLPFCE